MGFIVQKKVRVGFIICSDHIPLWQYRLIEKIIVSDFAEIGLMIKLANPRADSLHQSSNRFDSNESFIYSTYMKLDQYFNKLTLNALELKSINSLNLQAPSITIQSSFKEQSLRISEEDIERLGLFQIDLFMTTMAEDFCDKIISSVKYGVWTLTRGNSRLNNRRLSELAEVFGGIKTNTALSMLIHDEKMVLSTSSFYEQTETLSVYRYNNTLYWKTLSIILRRLKELYELGEKSFLEKIKCENQHPIFNFEEKKGNYIPCVSMMLNYTQKLIGAKIKQFFYFEQYCLLFAIDKGHSLSKVFSNYMKLIPPKDRFWADPFIIFEDHKYYVFIEEVISPCTRGHISFLTIDEDGNVTLPKKIIEKPYHMSYPFIFSYNDEYYMIPETSENSTIDLYKSVKFPEKWEKVMTLMDNIKAYDATVLFKDERWWLFVNVCVDEGTPSNDELFLFYSDDLFSKNWIAHKKNPIVSDVKAARPAGRFFTYQNNLYRPSQDSSKRYGYGVKINHVVSLSEMEYKEECISHIEPLWDQSILGVHTLNFTNQMTIIDGLMKRTRHPSSILRRIRKRWLSN